MSLVPSRVADFFTSLAGRCVFGVVGWFPLSAAAVTASIAALPWVAGVVLVAVVADGGGTLAALAAEPAACVVAVDVGRIAIAAAAEVADAASCATGCTSLVAASSWPELELLQADSESVIAEATTATNTT